MTSLIKCKKCRTTIYGPSDIVKSPFVNTHNLTFTSTEQCTSPDLVFLNDDNLPQWIKSKIVAADWSRGRLNCQKCDARIGGFDFVSGQKCQCSSFVLPPVHLIKSKIDMGIKSV